MARLMYDSNRPSAIPVNAKMVAGYIDGGTGRWSESDWNRFPNATKVRIARRSATNDGHVLDVETGIVWPPAPAAVDWVIMRRRAGADPTIYCNYLNGLPVVKQAFRDRGVAEPHYWVSRYRRWRPGDNLPMIPMGTVALQFANPPLHDQGHFDLSAVVDYWPGVDPKPEEKTEMEPLRNDADFKALIYRMLAIIRNDKLISAESGLTGDNLNNNLAKQLESFQLAFNTIRNDQAQILAGVTEIRNILTQITGSGITLRPEGEITVRADSGIEESEK